MVAMMLNDAILSGKKGLNVIFFKLLPTASDRRLKTISRSKLDFIAILRVISKNKRNAKYSK